MTDTDRAVRFIQHTAVGAPIPERDAQRDQDHADALHSRQRRTRQDVVDTVLTVAIARRKAQRAVRIDTAMWLRTRKPADLDARDAAEAAFRELDTHLLELCCNDRELYEAAIAKAAT